MTSTVHPGGSLKSANTAASILKRQRSPAARNDLVPAVSTRAAAMLKQGPSMFDTGGPVGPPPNAGAFDYAITDSDSDASSASELAAWEPDRRDDLLAGRGTPQFLVPDAADMDVDAFMRTVDKTIKKVVKVEQRKKKGMGELARENGEGASAHTKHKQSAGADYRMQRAFQNEASLHSPSPSWTGRPLTQHDIAEDALHLAQQAEELSSLQQQQRAVADMERQQRQIIERLRRNNTRSKDKQRSHLQELESLWESQQETTRVARLEKKLQERNAKLEQQENELLQLRALKTGDNGMSAGLQLHQKQDLAREARENEAVVSNLLIKLSQSRVEDSGNGDGHHENGLIKSDLVRGQGAKDGGVSEAEAMSRDSLHLGPLRHAVHNGEAFVPTAYAGTHEDRARGRDREISAKDDEVKQQLKQEENLVAAQRQRVEAVIASGHTGAESRARAAERLRQGAAQDDMLGGARGTEGGGGVPGSRGVVGRGGESPAEQVERGIPRRKTPVLSPLSKNHGKNEANVGVAQLLTAKRGQGQQKGWSSGRGAAGGREVSADRQRSSGHLGGAFKDSSRGYRAPAGRGDTKGGRIEGEAGKERAGPAAVGGADQCEGARNVSGGMPEPEHSGGEMERGADADVAVGSEEDHLEEMRRRDLMRDVVDQLEFDNQNKLLEETKRMDGLLPIPLLSLSRLIMSSGPSSLFCLVCMYHPARMRGWTVSRPTQSPPLALFSRSCRFNACTPISTHFSVSSCVPVWSLFIFCDLSPPTSYRSHSKTASREAGDRDALLRDKSVTACVGYVCTRSASS